LRSCRCPAGTNRSAIPRWLTVSSTGWCTTRTALRCAANRCVKRKESKKKSESIGRRKAVEKTGKKRPWKSLRDFHFSHSFNNNKLDDRDHFKQNAKTSVASLRPLIGSSRNSDRHQNGMLIDFIGIPKQFNIDDIEAPYTQVNNAAGTVGRQLGHAKFYKVASKFAHPTALLLCMDESARGMIDSLYEIGAKCTLTCFRHIEKTIR